MNKVKPFNVFVGSALVFLFLFVGFLFVYPNSVENIYLEALSQVRIPRSESSVNPLAPPNAKYALLPSYNPFTLEGHAFWTSVVGMNITAGIFDDCNKIAGGSKSSRLMPARFYEVFDKYQVKLATTVDKRSKEGTSLAYPQESLVLWNIITKVPYIKTVCETGFNTGEGTMLWLIARPDVHVYSFDIGSHPYAKPMAKHVQEIYPGRHNISWGDSTKTLPLFVKQNPDIVCDIIYVDGGHTYDISKEDFDNFYKLGHSGSVVILDNYPDYRLTFMKDLGGMWEDNRRLLNILEIFKCTYGRKKNQGFSFGLLTKPDPV